MSTSYKLSFVPQALQLHAKAKLLRNNDPSNLYVLQNKTLKSVEFLNDAWKQIPLLNNIDVRDIHFADLLGDGKKIMIVKTENGIRFYQQNGIQLKLLLKTDDFEDDNYFVDKYYDWDKPGSAIKMGHIYSDSNLVGIVGKREEYGIKIFAIMKDQLKSDEYPIQELDENIGIFGDVTSATIALSDLKKNGHENIIVHGRFGLNIYQINQNLDVEHQIQVPNSGKLDDSSEEIFFPNLTGQQYRDIVLLNDTGLFVYQYTNSNSNFKMINYTPSFSKLNGWRPEHRETIQFQDIDSDGRPDMILTGPQEIQVLSFNAKKNEWMSLLDNSELNAAQRHSNVMKVIPAYQSNTQYPWIVTKYQDRLYAAKIETIKEIFTPHTTPAGPHREPSPNTTFSPVIPPINKLLTKFDGSTPLLQDQLDYSEIYKAVGNTGTPSFHLPLIDFSARMSSLRLNIVYDGSNKASDLFGVGWSLPRNSITIVSPTIFPEDDVYYLMLDGSPYQLTLKPSASNDDVYAFVASNKRFRLTAHYHRNEEKWEIKSKYFEQIYGGHQNGAITWSQKEKAIPYGHNQRYANVWHLIRMEDTLKNVLEYAYESINVSEENGEKFTQEVYLKSINDMQGNQIVFNYSDKNKNEYDSKSHSNANTRSRYMRDYTVTTSNYQQTINFGYEINNGKRMLTKIQQINGIADQPVVQFAYAKISDAFVMQKITLPSKVNIEFESQLQKTVAVHDANDRKCDVKKDHHVDYGNDYTIVSHLDVQGRAVLRIYNPDMTEELYSPFLYEPDKKLPFLGKGSANSYQIFMFQHFIAILLTYKNDKELHLLRRNGSKWILTPKLYTFNGKAVIRSGKDFIVVADVYNSIIEAISWNVDNKQWEKIEPFNNVRITEATLIFSVSGRFILNANNGVLMIAYKNFYNQWQEKQIFNTPNIMNDINGMVNKFDFDDKSREVLLEFFKNVALKMKDNLILLNRWKIDGMQLYSKIDTFVLDSDYNVAKRQTIEVRQDNLATLSKDLDDDHGSTYVIGYKHEHNKFKITVKDVRGKKIRDFEQQYENRSMRKKELRKYLDQQEKGLRNFFPLEARKYIADFISHQIVCNNNYFTFDDDRWEEDTQASNRIQSDEKNQSFSIPIDKKLVLHKNGAKSSIRLHKYGNDADKLGDMVFDLNIMHLNQTDIKYPSYLAYKRDNQLNVIQFSNDVGIARTHGLPGNENLTELGSTRTLVTRIDRRTGHTLIFRHQYDVDRLPYNIVTTKTTINLEDGMKRIMGYEYGQAIAFGEMILYEKFVRIPNSDKTAHGWTEETIDFKKLTAMNRNTYNSDGELVKTSKSEEKPKENDHDDDDDETSVLEKYLYQNTTLLDRTGKMKIAQTFPHKFTDDDVGYFGFEDYEQNEIGGTSARKWQFDASNVVKDEFSFTGHNVLRLMNTTLKGEFHLAEKNQPYMVSSWMRPTNETFAVGQTIPYIKVKVSPKDGRNDSYSYMTPGEVKFKIGDWFYAEVIIDSYNAREYLRKLNEIHTDDIDLVALIAVSPNEDTSIDIDHIRFAPLSNVFAVNVYSSKNFQLKEVIGPSGLVERHIHDKYLKKIAIINEYGELKTLETYTKGSSIGRIPQPKCKIEIQPETGFYEQFAPESFRDRWKIENNTAWRVFPSQLEHISSSQDTIQFSGEMLWKSMGVRFAYNLQSSDAFIQFNSGLRLMHKIKNIGRAVLLNEQRSIPSDGEILIIVEEGRIFVWIDGGLYFDTFIDGSTFNMTFKIGGKTKITELIVFYNPSVTVTYVNTFDERLQQITLESANVSMVTGYRYDALGRQTIQTRPVRIGGSKQSLLAYNSNFVGNSKEYSETQYCNNPLNDKCAIGLPGHSVDSPYAKRYSYSPDDLFIENLFPLDQNYSYQVEHKMENVKITSVFDDKNHRVAWYLRAPKAKNLLSTYKYDENGKLVQMLPPAYHTSVNTFQKIMDRLHPDHYQEEKEKTLQNLLGVNTVYDENGKILTKTTPDVGKIENIYNKNGLVTFVLHYSNGNVEKILYHDYDNFDRLRSSGEVTISVPKEQLVNLDLNSNNSKVFQQFSYNDFEHNPLQRGKIVRMITFNHGEPFIEESLLNIDEENISKRVYVPNAKDQNNKPDIIAINKVYRAGKLKLIHYPVHADGEQLTVSFEYNKLGNVVGIGVPGDANKFVSFAYNPDGQISGETYEPWSVNKYTRQFHYNTAGFLTSISDRFLTENLYYTDGYSSNGYNDGMITRTEFNANWHDNSNNSQLGLNEHSFEDDIIPPTVSSVCFNEMRRAGYLNDDGRQVKTFYPNLEPEMPILCRYGASGRHIQNILGKNGYASRYGHSYDYGQYQELTKAKYFVGIEATMPLQADSFAKEIHGIDDTMSHDIWTRLTSSMYLIHDNQKIGSFMGHGKRGTSFINSSLHEDLIKMGDDYKRLGMPLENLLMAYYSQNRTTISSKTLLKWNIGTETERSRQIATKLAQMLNDNGYVKNPLAREFSNILKPYQPFIHDIVRVLFEHFSRALGETEFDTESYEIDENGNHRLFYTGFDRYEINYHNNTNQINNVNLRLLNLEPHTFPMKHDRRGNVIQALHKGIQRIEYNPISNRATKIQLVDGRTINFYYDVSGERVMKRVFDGNGQTTKEIHYTRDEFGRALVERQLKYIRSDLPPDVLITAYIYGPKGLIGFIRRDQFYNVINDHEGSIRLVIKNNEVVAAYDYLPYGGLMREFGNDPNAQISYRYTGQEWDEEIGLYNYHARFYDPSIGRFYQIDPAEQYFSPYKYAGNSPLMMVDPDGKFAFLIIAPIIFAVGGAYLGGAAANGNWDPVEWDWKSRNTWLGIVGGGISGAMLPFAAVGSVGALSAVGLSTVQAAVATAALGLGGAYLSMASANNNWDLTKFDYSSPGTWNAFFQGVTFGASIPAGIGGARHAFLRISSNLGKRVFVAGTIGVGAGSFANTGFNNDWDFSRPDMYFGLMQVFDDATNIPAFFRSSIKSINKGFTSIGHGIKSNSNAFKATSMIATKMALKGYGMTASAVILAAFYDELDLNDPTTIFFVVRQMAMVNLHYSIAKGFGKSIKKTYKQYRKNRNDGKYQKLNEHGGDEKHLICKRSTQNCEIPSDEDEVAIPREDELYILTDEDFDEQMRAAIKEKKREMEERYKKEPFRTLIERGDIDVPFGSTLHQLNDELADFTLNLRVRATEKLSKLEYVDTSDKRNIIKKLVTKKELNTRELPKALAVGTSDNFALAAFSGNKGKGYIFVYGILERIYVHNKGYGYIGDLLDGFVLKKNDFFIKHPDTILIHKGKDVIRNLDADGIQKFAQIKERDSNMLIHLDSVENQLILDHMDNVYRDRETNAFDAFSNQIGFTDDIKNGIHAKIQTDIHSKQNNANMETAMKSAFDEVLKLHPDSTIDVAQATQSYKAFRQKYYMDNKYPSYPVTNCAEAHVITGYKWIDEPLTNLRTHKILTWDKEIGIPERLEIFPPCENCKITAAPNYPDADPEWVKKPYGGRSNKRRPGNRRRRRFAYYEPNQKHIKSNSTAYVSNPTTSSRLSCDFNGENCVRKSPHSVVNNIFGWMGQGAKKFGSLINNWIDPTNNFKANNTEKGLSVDTSQVDQNGTLLLLDVLIRKFTAQKYNNTHYKHDVSDQEAHGFAIEVTAEFEEMLEHELGELDIDFSEIQGEIFKKIISCKQNEIKALLKSYIEKACQIRSVDGGFESEKYTIIMATLDEKISLLLSSR